MTSSRKQKLHIQFLRVAYRSIALEAKLKVIKYIKYVLTNYMEQNPASEVNNRSSSEENSFLLRNLKVLCNRTNWLSGRFLSTQLADSRLSGKLYKYKLN
jgi:hypothetical protein